VVIGRSGRVPIEGPPRREPERGAGRPTDRQRVLVVALLASLLLWNLPFGGMVLYPFKLLSTWVHELCHGLVMLVTGAGFSHLEIYRDTSGIAFASREAGAAASAAIASAGYLGASTVGACLLVLGQSQRGARAILAGLAIALALSAKLWIPEDGSNDFGLLAVSLAAAGFAVLAAVAGERIAIFVVNFVAAQACVQAVLDIRVLFRSELVINGQSVGSSDAHAMAAATFGSSRLWATVWLLTSFGAFFLAMRAMGRAEPAAAPAPDAELSEPAPAPPPPSPP
jgi:hypothetical protein